MNKIISRQFESESSRDLVQFGFIIVIRVDHQAALGAAKRNICYGAFLGDERGECFHFILTDRGREMHAAFCSCIKALLQRKNNFRPQKTQNAQIKNHNRAFLCALRVFCGNRCC